jgi:hypothetical protein
VFSQEAGDLGSWYRGGAVRNGGRKNMESASMAVYEVYLEFEMHLRYIYLSEK